MSDHGSLTASFRVARVTEQAQQGGGGAPVAEDSTTAAAVSTGDPIGQSGGFIAASDREARGGDRADTRDWGGGDDGFYGLR